MKKIAGKENYKLVKNAQEGAEVWVVLEKYKEQGGESFGSSGAQGGVEGVYDSREKAQEAIDNYKEWHDVTVVDKYKSNWAEEVAAREEDVWGTTFDINSMNLNSPLDTHNALSNTSEALIGGEGYDEEEEDYDEII